MSINDFGPVKAGSISVHKLNCAILTTGTCDCQKPPAVQAWENLSTGHRDGCSFGRTARCNCTYLAQWDRAPEYTAPTFKQEEK